MRDKKIKNMILQEMKGETPDVLDKILSNCKEKGKMKKEKSFNLRPILGCACVVVLAIFIGVIAFNQYNKSFKVDAVVEFDVNPSVELKISKANKVIEANALNNDGEKILDGMDLKSSSLNIAVNAIIGSMYKNGYISDLKNSVLVSVNSNDQAKSAKLQQEIANEIDSILKTYNIESAVLTQEYTTNNTTTAQDNGMSKGKAEFIDKILKSELTNKNGTKYTFEDLANLNINELNAILNSKNKVVNDVTSTGVASTKSYIGITKAKEIALSDAKVSESSIRDFDIELDYDYGKMIYEIDFDYNGYEYDYDIDAVTGAIIHKNGERDDDAAVIRNNQSRPSSSSQTQAPTRPATTTTTSNYISRANAKSVALNNAGVSESSVRGLSIELDKEYGKMIYEVDFESGRYEYEYDIDAVTGGILYKNVEVDD